MKSTTLLFCFTLLLSVMIIPACTPAAQDTVTEPQSDVQIDAQYEDKIVYATQADADTAPLRADCDERGGTFNECGSPCPSDAETCAAVCAFTCEL